LRCAEYGYDHEYDADFSTEGFIQSTVDGQKHSFGGKQKPLWKGNQNCSAKKSQNSGKPKNSYSTRKHAKRQKAKQALIRQLQFITS